MNRADRSSFAAWWWTVDRVALLAMLALIGIGLMLAFAASPAATGGPVTGGDFRYAAKQVTFAAVAACILGSASLLSLQQLKIVAAVTFALAHDRLVPGAVHRQRSARRQTLDRSRLADPAAFGIPQARLRRSWRGHSCGSRANAVPQARHHADADRAGTPYIDAAARCRADRAAACAVGGAAVLQRRIAGLDGRARRCAVRRSAVWPSRCFRMCATASRSSSIRTISAIRRVLR